MSHIYRSFKQLLYSIVGTSVLVYEIMMVHIWDIVGHKKSTFADDEIDASFDCRSIVLG